MENSYNLSPVTSQAEEDGVLTLTLPAEVREDPGATRNWYISPMSQHTLNPSDEHVITKANRRLKEASTVHQNTPNRSDEHAFTKAKRWLREASDASTHSNAQPDSDAGAATDNRAGVPTSTLLFATPSCTSLIHNLSPRERQAFMNEVEEQYLHRVAPLQSLSSTNPNPLRELPEELKELEWSTYKALYSEDDHLVIRVRDPRNSNALKALRDRIRDQTSSDGASNSTGYATGNSGQLQAAHAASAVKSTRIPSNSGQDSAHAAPAAKLARTSPNSGSSYTHAATRAKQDDHPEQDLGTTSCTPSSGTEATRVLDQARKLLQDVKEIKSRLARQGHEAHRNGIGGPARTLTWPMRDSPSAPSSFILSYEELGALEDILAVTWTPGRQRHHSRPDLSTIMGASLGSIIGNLITLGRDRGRLADHHQRDYREANNILDQMCAQPNPTFHARRLRDLIGFNDHRVHQLGSQVMVLTALLQWAIVETNHLRRSLNLSKNEVQAIRGPRASKLAMGQPGTGTALVQESTIALLTRILNAGGLFSYLENGRFQHQRRAPWQRPEIQHHLPGNGQRKPVKRYQVYEEWQWTN